MALTQITAVNLTAGAINLTRLGLTVPLSGEIILTDYAYVHEIKTDESLHTAIVAGDIRLDVGDHELTVGQSINWFINVSSEVKYPADALADSNVASLSGTTTIDSASLAVGDRVLLTAQSTGAENGIWVVNSGAWTRPNDFPAGGSAAGSMVQINRGTTYGDQLWTCDTDEGSDVIDTDSLTFTASSGGATNLQEAYVAGNTITTSGGEGSVIIAGTETLQITATSGLDVDTIFDFDGTSFDVLMTGSNGFSIDGTAASNVTATAGDLTLSTVTSGSLIISAVAAATIDSTTLSIDSTDTTNLTMTANDAGAKTFTIDAINGGAGAGNLDINVDNGLTIDSDTFSIDGTAASNISVTSSTSAEDLTISLIGATDSSILMTSTGTGTDAISISTSAGGILESSAGVFDIDAAGILSLNSSAAVINIGNDAVAQNINIGTAGARTVSIGNQTAGTSVEIDGVDGIRLDGNVAVIGNLDVQGTTTSIDSAVVNIADNFLYLNKDYTTTSSLVGGMVVNYLPTSTVDTVASGGFTAGGGGDATIATTAAAAFAASDIIQVSNAANPANDGVYEVLTHAANVLTIRGPSTSTVETFSQDDFITDTTVQGSITKVTVSVLRAGVDGIWETGAGAVTGITYSDLAAAGGNSLTQAYVVGNTLTTDGGNGDFIVAGTETMQITTTGGLNLDAPFDFDGATFDVLMSGTNGFSIDGTAASNVTVTAGDLTLSTLTSGDVVILGVDSAKIQGLRYYGASATAPSSPAPADGDKYFDTALDMEMRYDGTRTKWLSVEAMYLQFGRNGATNTGQYYRGIDGRVFSATIGYRAPHDGTIVAMGYTRSDTDTTDFEVTEGGTVRSTLTSSAVSGSTVSLDNNFTAAGILAMKNKDSGAGANITDDVAGWVKVKWRA